MKQPILHQPRSRGAFTLVELLVVTAIIAILVSLFFPLLGRAKDQGRFVNEISSARQLMIAFQMYAEDHNHRVLPGYRYGFTARDRLGREIGHPVNARYPWRLAPYLGNNFQVMYVNRNRARLESFAAQDEDSYTYAASVFPSLGINSIFVGGDDLVLPPGENAFARFGPFCVLKLTDVLRPTDLIAFASARAEFNGEITEGCYRVEAPFLQMRVWAEEYSPSLSPELFGFVHPRYHGKTVVGLVDGHADGFTLRKIQDMRHWANPADRPDWTLSAR